MFLDYLFFGSLYLVLGLGLLAEKQHLVPETFSE